MRAERVRGERERARREKREGSRKQAATVGFRMRAGVRL
jgi:hypothetical protein